MIRGRHISIEGPDGAGKSTAAEAVALALGAVLVRAPGGSPVRDLIRQALFGAGERPSRKAELLLFLADQAELAERTIKPALEAGRTVISDRGPVSTWAYQERARSGGSPLALPKLLRAVNQGAMPDLVIVLDAPAEVLEARIRARGDGNRYDAAGREFRERLRDAYAHIPGWLCPDVRAVDASGTPAEVAAAVLDEIARED